MSTKRICVACGTEYDYCPKCAKYAKYPKWMWKCDTEICNELFDVVSAYKMDVKSIEDVKVIVDTYGITDYSKYSDGIQKVLNELVNNTESIDVEPVIKANKKKKKWYDTIEETPVPISMDVELNDNVVEEPVDNRFDSFEGISEE